MLFVASVEGQNRNLNRELLDLGHMCSCRKETNINGFMLFYEEYKNMQTIFTFLIDFLRLDVGEEFSGGGSSTGLSFLLFENFFRLRLSAASAPKFKCICR